MSDAAELGKDLAALDAKATTGKWGFHDDVNPHCLTAGLDSSGAYIYVEHDDGTNGALIVALRNNLPAILDALSLVAAVNECHDGQHYAEDEMHAMELQTRAAEIRATWDAKEVTR